jgi:ribosomal protein S18 acetylase RimI-like enzyme
MAKSEIRAFTGADLDAVGTIWNRALRRDPINPGRLRAWLFGDPDYWPGPECGFFVATRGGTPVGFAARDHPALSERSSRHRAGARLDSGAGSRSGSAAAGVGRALLEGGAELPARGGPAPGVGVRQHGLGTGLRIPRVDRDAYLGALALFTKAGFVVDHEPVAMSREAVDFDVDAYHRQAWDVGREIEVAELSPARVPDFLAFLAEAFPGDWNMAARAKIRSGALHEVLIASRAGQIFGYCQWEGEHFGPFGVVASQRSQKIGAKLFVEAVRRIRAADGRSVWFNWADEGAARFYARFGLRPTRRFAILRKDL